MHEITWIGSNLGITDDVGGLEATQSGEFTVINVGEPRRNPIADVLAELPLFNIKAELLNKLADVIENIVKDNSGPKCRVVIHDLYGIERSGLVAAWTVHRANGITLDEAYEKIKEKNNKIVNYSNWIRREEII